MNPSPDKSSSWGSLLNDFPQYADEIHDARITTVGSQVDVDEVSEDACKITLQEKLQISSRALAQKNKQEGGRFQRGVEAFNQLQAIIISAFRDFKIPSDVIVSLRELIDNLVISIEQFPEEAQDYITSSAAKLQANFKSFRRKQTPTLREIGRNVGNLNATIAVEMSRLLSQADMKNVPLDA